MITAEDFSSPARRTPRDNVCHAAPRARSRTQRIAARCAGAGHPLLTDRRSPRVCRGRHRWQRQDQLRGAHRSIASVFARVKEHFLLRGPDVPTKIVMTRHEMLDEHTLRMELAYNFPSTVSHLEVTSTFDQMARRPDHQHFVTAMMSGTRRDAILDGGNRSVTFDDRLLVRTSVWLPVAGLLIPHDALRVSPPGPNPRSYVIVRGRPNTSHETNRRSEGTKVTPSTRAGLLRCVRQAWAVAGTGSQGSRTI